MLIKTVLGIMGKEIFEAISSNFPTTNNATAKGPLEKNLTNCLCQSMSIYTKGTVWHC